MKKLIIGLLFFALFTASTSVADAHPGRTDKNGGHYCWTNCEKWGLKYGEYHYHNGGNSSTQTTTQTKKPTKPQLVTADVYIDGVKQSYNQDAYIKNGTTLVPMRGIFEALGASVQYDNNSQKVTGVKEGKNIVLTVGNKKAYIKSNGATSSVELSHPTEITNGSTMVPLRFISESLGADVQWDSISQSVKITSK